MDYDKEINYILDGIVEISNSNIRLAELVNSLQDKVHKLQMDIDGLTHNLELAEQENHRLLK